MTFTSCETDASFFVRKGSINKPLAVCHVDVLLYLGTGPQDDTIQSSEKRSPGVYPKSVYLPGLLSQYAAP